MDKFEYFVTRETHPTEHDNAEHIQNALNIRGNDGWELVQVNAGKIAQEIWCTYIWKRKIPHKGVVVALRG